MSTGCDVNEKNMEVIHASDQLTENEIEGHVFLNNPDLDLVEIILKDMGKKIGDVITENELNDAFKTLFDTKYGKDVRKILGGQASAASITLAGKITALLQSNPHLLPVFEPYILKRIPEGRIVGTGTGKIHLAVLPLSTLKNIYAQIHGMVNRYAGDKGAHGSFKGFISHLTTPGQMIYKDPSGGLSIIQKATRDYPDLVARNISLFMKHPENLPDEIKFAVYSQIIGKDVKDFSAQDRRKAKKFVMKAMEKIVGEVDDLGGSQDLAHSNSQDRMTNLFSMLMRGEVSLEHLKNGELMIYSEYGIMHDDDGNIRRYDSTHSVLEGTPIKGFQKLVPLKDYEPPNGKRGDFNLVLTDGSGNTKNMFKILEGLVSDARIIDNAVWHYQIQEMQKSLDSLYDNLQVSLGLDKKTLNVLFFRQGTTQHDTLLKWLKQNHPDKFELYNIFNETFGMLVSQENIITNGGVVDLEAPTYRENHWPTLYNKDNLKLMIDKLETELSEEIEYLKEKKVIYKSLRNLYKNGTKDEWKLYTATGQLNSVMAIKNNMDDYHVDLNHNTIIPLAKDNKHFKRISGAYDVRNGRRDDGVYFDYLKNIMSTIQRNHMAADLVKAISLINKSKRIPDDEKKGIIQYTTNLFKVPFHQATVKGLFGVSNDGISKKITGMFGTYLRHYTPQYITSLFKNIGAILSGLYLPGIFTTPITNLSGILQNVNDYGAKTMLRAMKAYRASGNAAMKEGIEKLITLSGIAEFSDFFSRSMVNGIVKVQLEQDIHWHILGEMTKYHKNVDKMGEEKAQEIFLEAVTKLLAQSESYLAAEDIAIQDTTRIGVRKKVLQREKRLASANKLVQFSIEKEFEFRKLVEHPDTWKMLNETHRFVAQGYASIVKLISKGTFVELTMSNTEKYIRSVSFIIGIQRAYDSHLINRKQNWWEYTDQKDIDRAIKIGREYTYFSNFGMSTQAVGSYNYNGLGNLVGKFKYWSQQKAGRDIRIFKEAYRSLKSEKKIEGRGNDRFYKFKHFDAKAIVKLIGKIVNPAGWTFYTGATGYQKRLRKENPEVAALRTFLTTQVMMTLLWDVALGGPLRFAQYIPGIGPVVQGFRQYIYRGMGGAQMKNATSDVASLMIFPLTLFGRLGVASLWGVDDDDEMEEKERLFAYYMRRIPFLGYLPTLAFDHIMAILYVNSRETDNAAKKIVNATLAYPKIGVGLMPGTSIVKGFAEDTLEEVLDAGFGY